MLNIHVSTMKHADCIKIRFNLVGIHAVLAFSNGESLFGYDIQKELNLKLVTLNISA